MNRWFWPIWWQSPIWVMPADLPIKLDPVVLADSELKLGNDGFADLELKLGIDLFAGKSEITEGCSDFREIGDSMFGCQRTAGNDAAGAAVRRKAERRGKAGRRRKAGCCGTT